MAKEKEILGRHPFKKPVRLKEVQYVISPNHLEIMPGLWKDMGHKIAHKAAHWPYAVVLLGTLFGPIWYCKHTVHQRELSHRY